MTTISREVSRRAAVMLAALAATACAGNTVSRQFNTDYDCNERVSVADLGRGFYEASGCNQRAIYDCTSSRGCSLWEDEAKPSDQPKTVVVVAVPDEGVRLAGSEKSEPHLEKKGGNNVVALDVRIGPGVVLELRATPDKNPDVVQFRLRAKAEDPSADQKCQLAWMIDGQKRDAPKAKFARGSYVLSHQVELPRDFVSDLAVAQQVAFKSCDHRWSLQGAPMEKVHQFIAMYEQELAWKGDSRNDSTAGLVAPSGGWPAWKSPEGSLPTAVKSAPLEGPELFKKLAPSVFQVIARGASRTSQGSAVAVSKNELLTNCHVVQAAQKVVVKQEGEERRAELVSADPATDRCVLRVAEGTLVPISGVRTYADLEVGEALFTIGSPSGLELSLSNGVLSGRRDEDGKSYVQTTAPISPGSSGGGLFDARGNLVGITSMALVGRQRLNQSLNFAVPADSFWKN